MSRNDDLYKKTTGNLNLYGSTTTGSEPDMRQELINTLDGTFQEIAKGHPALLRKMRRDSNGEKTLCPCVDEITHEPDKDRLCMICLGESFFWDEEEIIVYRTLEDSDVDNVLKNELIKPGLIKIPLVVFYIRYSNEITEDDKIVTLELNLDGTAKVPKRRKGVYRIGKAWDYRADNGKLEYWKVFTHLEDVKYLNVPSFDEV